MACVFSPPSTWTGNRQPTQLCLMGSPHMNIGMAGAAIWKIFCSMARRLPAISTLIGSSRSAAGAYVHGLVTAVSPNAAAIKIGGYSATLSRADVAWTKTPWLRLLARGDVVYVKVLRLSQMEKRESAWNRIPGVQGALLAIDNASGEVRAMVGGTRFQSVQVQPRHAGAAAGGVVVQALCVHGRDRSRRDARTTPLWILR